MESQHTGKEVICVKVPELNVFNNALYVGMPGLTIINEFADLYLLRNAEGAEGMFPRDCFKRIEEIDVVDYLDSTMIEMEEARFIAEKQGRTDLVDELEKLKIHLQTLRTDVLEERT